MATSPRRLVGPNAQGAVSSQLDSAVAVRFVQGRLALFAKVIFSFGLFYVLMAVILTVTGKERFFSPGRESHLLAVVIAGTIWLVARRRQSLGPSALKLLDGGGTLALNVCMVVMGHRYAQQNPWADMAGLLSVFHVVLARAVIVPSSARRTLLITALSFTAVLLSQLFTPLRPGIPAGVDVSLLRILGPLFTGGTGTALATVASAVIYGLHREVNEARQLGQYTLEERIGAGGMGEVYRARHAMLRRPTAIKLLTGEGSERALRRFEKEVQLTARLTHPNTISIFDYGRTPDGVFYYAMELLDGVTLEELVERYGSQSPARVIHTLVQVCAALREAHGAGLIHRDIKPANVFVCRHGGLPDVVKVLDFGLVKEVENLGDVQESNVNLLIGTPLYMSPEGIAAPGKVTEQSDLYALGAVGYFLLTGTPVFSGDTIVEVCSHHLHTPPEPPSRRVSTPIPGDLERIVLDCLAKSPGDRPANAHEMARRLSACAVAHPWTEEDAEAWWRAHDVRRTESTTEPRAAASRTLQVTLEGRVAANPAAGE
jgi:serine/threonine-protein kinase